MSHFYRKFKKKFYYTTNLNLDFCANYLNEQYIYLILLYSVYLYLMSDLI